MSAVLSASVEPLRLSIIESARILGISRAKLYQHIKCGKIRIVKDGKSALVTMAELRRYVAESEAESKALTR